MQSEYKNCLETDILGHGDSINILNQLPDNVVDLIFTSPPYYNAREYSQYATYEEYLQQMQDIFKQCLRVLKPGRFMAINSCPVIIPRSSRSQESTRLPIPFDLHSKITELKQCKFIEDIIWEKPLGASIPRNRTFHQNRLPLIYKTNSVTEYIFVYRKNSDNLIEWHLKDHPYKEESKIDDYEPSNIWKICPAWSNKHPAIFPNKLANNIIKYYSLKNDFVMDPFAGSGTVGIECLKLQRHFILIEKKEEYYQHIKNNILLYVDNIKELK